MIKSSQPFFSKGSIFKYLAFSLIVFSLFTTSCVPKEKMVFLQDLSTSDSTKKDTTYAYQRTAYRLQNGDIVDVQFRSMEPEVNELMNQATSGNVTQAAQIGAGDIYYMTGYSINDNGKIELPLVGYVQAAGLTIKELQLEVEKSFKTYFKEFFVSVRLGGVRYSALGEFMRPGKYTILQNQVTIFDAIANAGDFTMVANRENVKIIRQFPEGSKIFEVNLLDQNIIHDPMYWIQPNDIIYVEPLKAKSWGVGVTGAQTLTLILSVLTSTLVVLSYINNLSN